MIEKIKNKSFNSTNCIVNNTIQSWYKRLSKVLIAQIVL